MSKTYKLVDIYKLLKINHKQVVLHIMKFLRLIICAFLTELFLCVH